MVILKVKKSPIRIIRYQEIQGMSVQDILHNDKKLITIPELTEFINRLHDKGILFTSLHMGNIIKLEAGDFALIDVTNTHFFRSPLGLRNRARNLANFLSYKDDVDIIQKGLNTTILEEYVKHIGKPSGYKKRLIELVKKKVLAKELKRDER